MYKKYVAWNMACVCVAVEICLHVALSWVARARYTIRITFTPSPASNSFRNRVARSSASNECYGFFKWTAHTTRIPMKAKKTRKKAAVHFCVILAIKPNHEIMMKKCFAKNMHRYLYHKGQLWTSVFVSLLINSDMIWVLVKMDEVFITLIWTICSNTPERQRNEESSKYYSRLKLFAIAW